MDEIVNEMVEACIADASVLPFIEGFAAADKTEKPKEGEQK